jgi:hypothetical protein
MSGSRPFHDGTPTPVITRDLDSDTGKGQALLPETAFPLSVPWARNR